MHYDTRTNRLAACLGVNALFAIPIAAHQSTQPEQRRVPYTADYLFFTEVNRYTEKAWSHFAGNNSIVWHPFSLR